MTQTDVNLPQDADIPFIDFLYADMSINTRVLVFDNVSTAVAEAVHAFIHPRTHTIKDSQKQTSKGPAAARYKEQHLRG